SSGRLPTRRRLSATTRNAPPPLGGGAGGKPEARREAPVGLVTAEPDGIDEQAGAAIEAGNRLSGRAADVEVRAAAERAAGLRVDHAAAANAPAVSGERVDRTGERAED